MDCNVNHSTKQSLHFLIEMLFCPLVIIFVKCEICNCIMYAMLQPQIFTFFAKTCNKSKILWYDLAFTLDGGGAVANIAVKLNSKESLGNISWGLKVQGPNSQHRVSDFVMICSLFVFLCPRSLSNIFSGKFRPRSLHLHSIVGNQNLWDQHKILSHIH